MGWQAELLSPLRGDLVAAAAEGQWLDRERCHAVLGDPDREVVLITVLICSVAPLGVGADNVIYPASVTGHADHCRVRTLFAEGREQIGQHPQIWLTLEDDLFTAVPGKLPQLKCLCTQWTRR